MKYLLIVEICDNLVVWCLVSVSLSFLVFIFIGLLLIPLPVLLSLATRCLVALIRTFLVHRVPVFREDLFF